MFSIQLPDHGKRKKRPILLCPKRWNMKHFLTRVTVLLHSHCSECQSNRIITSSILREKNIKQPKFFLIGEFAYFRTHEKFNVNLLNSITVLKILGKILSNPFAI